MDAENGFLIEGRVYEVPTLDSLTLDEAQTMYDLCGLVQEDFVLEAGETDQERDARVGKLTRHPGFMASLVQIAYERGNPDVKPGAVKLVLGKTNRLEVFSTLAPPEPEADEIPLVSTSEPNARSSNGSLDSDSSTKDSNVSSGSGSDTVSGRPGGGLVSIGTTRSATSSISGLTTSGLSGPRT